MAPRTAAARAPSKLILLGEHSVVYGQPALAVPLARPGSEAVVTEAEDRGAPVEVRLEDLGLRWTAGQDPGPGTLPFARLVDSARREWGVPGEGWTLSVRSEIPAGCGLGSGASVATAALKAIAAFFGVEQAPERLSAMVYEVERLHHGTPSGIDNTVTALGRPVLFRKGPGPEPVQAPAVPASLVVGHTGVRHKTSEVVRDVARAREADRDGYDAMFSEIGAISAEGAREYSAGRWRALGGLMDRNQGLLERIGVSSPELERLIRAARGAGALGAKLTGAGRGGCMAALAEDPEHARRIRSALQAAGAAAAMAAEPIGAVEE